MKSETQRLPRGVPVWLAILVAGMLLSLPRGAGAQATSVMPNVSEEYLKFAADHERAALGLPPLRFDEALSSAARHHAELMVSHNSISHRYTGEADLAARASLAGAKFSLITENVAQAPSAVLIHAAWMHSEGHKHNLLDPNVDSIGISVISRNGQAFAVEDFARSVAVLSPSQQEGIVSRVVREAGLDLDVPDREAYAVCAGSENAETTSRAEFVMRYTTDNLDRIPDDLSSRLRSGRYSRAVVASCPGESTDGFSMYRLAVLLYGR